MRLCYCTGQQCARCRHRFTPAALIHPKPLRRAALCWRCWDIRRAQETVCG